MRTVIMSAALSVLAAILVLPAALDGAALNRVVLNVVDYSDISFTDGWQAEHRTHDILASAGVVVAWRPTISISRGGDVTVLLLSKRMSRQQQSAEAPGQRLLGLASPQPARRVWVHVPAVVDQAQRLHTSTGALLGHVISHETLHVMAGLPHTPQGLMSASPRLDREGVDDTLTNEEVALVATAMRARGALVAMLAQHP